ncbi:MAG: D-alanyl-D-alanine carboxypeptidase DacB1 [Candidatus Dormibacteria bacterium]
MGGDISILRYVQIPGSLWARSRRMVIGVLLMVVALLSPSAAHAVASPVSTGPPPARDRPASEHLVATPPPWIDTDTRDLPPREFPLKILEQPTGFRDASARYHGAPPVVAGSAILVDLDRAEVMWSRSPHARRAPASTAKMLSALVAMVNFPPDRVITVTPEAAEALTVETRMELLPGERLSVRELLTGMLTISANDATRAVAYGTVGMDDYVTAMNRQARALGLRDSNFSNPVGFPDDPGMYSSAYDLAAIAAVAYREFPLFAQLTATRDVDLPAGGEHRDYRLHNINRLPDIYPPALGTKSGYTDEAGPCLVSMAMRNGHRELAVLMSAPHMFDQSRALLEWGFAQDGLPPLPLPTATPPSVPSIQH